MLDSMPPELLDEWQAWNELHDFPITGERTIAAIANAASAVCGSNGIEVEPWRIIPGARPPIQTDREQQAIFERLAAMSETC